MSERKIIIDDVNVSDCIYLPYCEDKQGNCGNNPNCYFKQLNRKEQECEKYKQALNEILSIATNSDMLPCADPDADCTKCKDRITEKGKRCMKYGLIKIKNVVKRVKDGRNDTKIF